MDRLVHKLMVFVSALLVFNAGVVVFEDEVSQFIISRLYTADAGDGVAEGAGEAQAASGEVDPAVDAMEQFILTIVMEDIDLKYGSKEYLYETPWSFSEFDRDLLNLRLRVVSHDESVVRAEPYGGVRAVGEGATVVELYDTGEFPYDAVGKLLGSCSITVEGGIPDPVAGAVFALGDVGPGGGFVFYDAGDYAPGWRYLEVAPDYWTERGYDQPVFWADLLFNDETLKHARRYHVEDTSPLLGSGQENTRIIVDFFGPGRYPAWLCSDLVLNGKNDWFLPSAEELGKLMEFLRRCETSSGYLPVQLYDSGEYWSSSLDDVFVAWVGTAGSWSVETLAILNEGCFRPIRAF
jgi:hypothetical protein